MIVSLQSPVTPWRRPDSAAIHNIMIFGMDCNKSALTGARQSAIIHGNGAPFGSRGNADSCVVLLSAINTVWKLIVDVQPVKLSRLLVVNSCCQLCYIGVFNFAVLDTGILIIQVAVK